jgi:hypothetical protein
MTSTTILKLLNYKQLQCMCKTIIVLFSFQQNSDFGEEKMFACLLWSLCRQYYLLNISFY